MSSKLPPFLPIGPVLIVDDQRLSLIATAAVVGGVLPDCELLFAEGVVEALEVVESSLQSGAVPGCAILDVTLGDGDGFMVLAAMRAQGIDCPAIFYTAHVTGDGAAMHERMGEAPGAVLLSKDEPHRLALQLCDWFVLARR